MLNRITITGRLTADIELRTSKSGISITRFSIACKRNYKSDSGEYETDFFDIIAWRGTAELVSRYFSKGSMITVDGRLQTRKYTDKNGNNRTIIEIIAENVYFGESKSGENKNFNNSNTSTVNDIYAPTITSEQGEFIPAFDDIEDDDLPF